MLYVVVEKLIPEMSQGQNSNVGTVYFAVGYFGRRTAEKRLFIE